MSIIKESYQNNIDKVWYNSSNIFYSECLDKDDELKQLKVVFNNGGTYLYKDVEVGDYLMLKFGGVDGSQGKALNKFIKTKYEYEKLENTDINSLLIEMEKISNDEIKNKTYFISGHRDITQEEFKINYESILKEIALNDTTSLFIIGDYNGVDIMAQNYLLDELEVDPERITVFHMLTEPRNINSKITQFIGGFESDEERDSAMTNASFKDIAFIRDNTKLSGTAQNILRRHLIKKL